jgi:hypothetical protein
MRNLKFFAAFVLLLICYGCSQIPELILYNNTGEDVGITCDCKIIDLRAKSHRKIQSKLMYTGTNGYNVVVVRNNRQYGYKVSPDNLVNLKRANNTGLNIKYYLLLQNDGNIYLMRNSHDMQASAAPQPSGFPAKPTLIR